ncbi:MAG TPA: SGNH/GDSL hydrolase family protein [Chitinophagales bacterium]|nr:SGNH/GDSL hydrolase family protein [Chitinophagales bacterium]
MSTHKKPGKPFISFDRNFGFYVNFGVSYKLLLGVLLVAYLVWEMYWVYKVGYKAIKWHTHLVVYVYIWLLLSLVVSLAAKVTNGANHLKYQVGLASICVTLLLTEGVLYGLGIGATYTEQLKYGYTSPYSTQFETWYRTRTPNDSFYFVRPEFTHLRKTNSLGFSDREWPRQKNKGQKRILCLGDSFTEGIGTEQDSTYVSWLSYFIQSEDTDCMVMNAGTASNDPFVNFVNYRDHLYAYRPDVIIQTLSTNDIKTDIALRGGMERFVAGGKVKYNNAPWWEPLYGLSYISRLFFTAMGYNELLLRDADIDIGKIDELVVALFKEYAATAAKNNCKLLVVLQPLSGNVNTANYDYDFVNINQKLSAVPNLYLFDLLPFYSNYIKVAGKPVGSFYWKQDGHHNAEGYKMMALGVKRALDSFDIVKETAIY